MHFGKNEAEEYKEFEAATAAATLGACLACEAVVSRGTS
jgi:hypothetical protein